MKLETIKQKLLGDERAVSPVIGVILMVAITVILAAVIGTFVLGLGENVSQTAPQSSMSFSDAEANFDTATDGQALFVVTHDGGTGLAANEVKVVIRQASDNKQVATWDGSWDSTNLQALQLNGADIQTTDTINTGSTLAINEGSGLNWAGTDNTQYKIQIIHKPSESTVASGTVTLQ